jgi:hypothetical protein
MDLSRPPLGSTPRVVTSGALGPFKGKMLKTALGKDKPCAYDKSWLLDETWSRRALGPALKSYRLGGITAWLPPTTPVGRLEGWGACQYSW